MLRKKVTTVNYSLAYKYYCKELCLLTPIDYFKTPSIDKNMY